MFRRALYLSFKIVYAINRWLREHFTPLGILIISCTLVAGIFGTDLKNTLSYQLFTFTAALTILSILASLRFKSDFTVQRQLPDFATVGEDIKYKIKVHNHNKKPQSELIVVDQMENPFPPFHEYLNSYDPKDRIRNWFDRLIGYPRLMGIMQRKKGGSSGSALLPKTAAYESQELTATLTLLRRGYIRFSSVAIGKPDPFGIYKSIKKIPRKESLLVLPKTYRIPAIHLFGHRKYQHGGVTQASSVGDSQEFLSLRDYRPGDPLRSIHWRSFAKLGKPIVREYQDEFFVRQALLLDTWLDQQAEIVFEEAVSIAASFTLACFDTDSLLDLLFVGTESFRFTSGRGISQPENMLEVLACVDVSKKAPFTAMQNLVLQTCVESSGLICIFLDWSKERQALVEQVMALEIPVYVFIVTMEEKANTFAPGPLARYPEKFNVIPVNDVQNALDRITI